MTGWSDWAEWIPEIVGSLDLLKNRGDASRPDTPPALSAQELIDLATALSFYDQSTPFSETRWSQGEDGRYTQTQSPAPGMEGAVDRLRQRAGGQANRFESPQAFNDLGNSILQARMERRGMPFAGGFSASAQSQGAPQVGAPSGGGQAPAAAPNSSSSPVPQMPGEVPPSSPGYIGSLAGGNMFDFMPSGGGSFGGGFGAGYGGPSMGPSGLGDFGRPDLGTESGLGVAERGGDIGKAASALFGLPGLGHIGKFLGDRYIDGHAFMNPVNPDDPWGDQAYQDRADELFGFESSEDDLPNSPAGSGGVSPRASFLAGYRSAAPWRSKRSGK